MGGASSALEGLKLIADWAKWLITVETAAIAVIGAYLKGNPVILPRLVKLVATVAVGSFVISMAAAALLLLSLPEIAQRLDGTTNIWLDKRQHYRKGVRCEHTDLRNHRIVLLRSWCCLDGSARHLRDLVPCI